MKIRNGFVSNSSSSSFILFFNNIPKDETELKKILFGNKTSIFTTNGYDDKAILIDKVVNIIFNDIKKSTVLYKNDVINIFKEEVYISEYSGIEEYLDILEGTEYLEEYKDLFKKFVKDKKEYKEKYKKDHWGFFDKVNELSQPLIDILIKAFSEKITDSKFIEVEYSDNDGEIMSYIEHSGVLSPITIKQFNHH